MREAKVIIIKKKSKTEAHHGGAWKVAYADFVTAMMALFIVLWLLSQTDQESRQKLSEYFRTGLFSGAPSVVMGGSGVADKGYLDGKDAVLQLDSRGLKSAAKSVKQALLAAAKNNPGLTKQIRKNVRVQVTEEGLLIQILDGGEDLLFDLSSSELKPALVEVLRAVGPALGNLNNELQVHGHTDARPFPEGSSRSNWLLSFERADAARRALEGFGVREGQIAGVFAHADRSLYVPENPEANENRRLAILAVREGANLAGGQASSQAAGAPTPIQPTADDTVAARSEDKGKESNL